MESELENIILVLLANKIGLDILFILYGKSLVYVIGKTSDRVLSLLLLYGMNFIRCDMNGRHKSVYTL